MQTRDDMIQQLRDQLGNQATIGDAEALFEFMRDRDQITFDERDGFQLANDLDLFVAFDQMTACQCINVTMQGGVNLQLNPSTVQIELVDSVITVKTADNITLFAGHNLPADTHGAYADWAEWNGCRFATPADRARFEETVQSFVEKCPA